MKKKLLVKRILSIIIAVTLLISAVPISLAVQDLLIGETTSKIVREVTELREESVKHFLCEDGSYIAATYSAPVHYKENGEWKEIDNSLSLDRATLSESGKPTYTTKSGGLDVSIPQDFSDDQKITAKNKGYEISFGLNANQKNVSLKKSASIVDVEALSSNTEVKNIAVNQNAKVLAAKNLSANDVVEKHNEEMMSADNQSGAVTFDNVFPNTDLEYIVSSSNIKENIVVYEPQNEYTYSFDMDFEGLIPVTHTDGSISLVEPSNPDTFVFWIEAPYMYDANNEESIDIEMTLEENGDEYLLTLVASDEWINDENRVFPVVIDPTIYLSDSDINDVFVIDGLYAGSPRVKNELRVGRNLTNVTRTYIKPTMPTNIPVGSVVSSAYLKLYQDYYYQAPFADDISIRVYDCCNVSTWKSHEVSWNNQPFDNSDNGYKSTSGAIWLSSKTASDSASSYTFTITDAVQRWVNGGTNNGLMVASSNESAKTQIDFHSSRVSDSANHPDIWFTYSAPGVSQTSWYTDSQASTSSVINVTTSKSWTVSSDQSWLTISNITSSGFKMNTLENPNVYERTGAVTVNMGNTTIGTINVTQSGSAPSLSVDTTYLNFESESDTKTISVNSNTSWTITTPSWITAEPSAGSGNQSVNITVDKNEGDFTRDGIVTVNVGSLTKDVNITQLDKISNYFSKVNDSGVFVQKDSSEYNHALATWAMELSFAAYNYPDGSELPMIPGLFMNGYSSTVAELLQIEGFYDMKQYNYSTSDAVAHTIGHRTIVVDNAENTDLQTEAIQNDNLGNNSININDYNGLLENGVLLYDTASTGNDSGSTVTGESRTTVAGVGTTGSDNRTYIGSSLSNSVTQNNNPNERALITIVVRGSVTGEDWMLNLNTQFNSEKESFETGRDMVLNSLYYGTGDTKNCLDCNGNGCETCKGYIPFYGLVEPIILVTGHSLGAAVANLTAGHLNVCTEHSACGNNADVYAYTFATPNTVNGTINDNNINNNTFNILNNNDVVPLVPLPNNSWSRYGRDYHITMPMVLDILPILDTALLGFGGHAMPNYLTWLNNLPEILNKLPSQITNDDLSNLSNIDDPRGLLPRILSVNCPVSVSIYDELGNLLAYESQNTNTEYPQLTNSEIVSWIAEDGAKMFFIPCEYEAIDVHVEAYDYGTMSVTFETIGAGEPISSKTFNDVVLYPGKEFLVEVSEDVLPEDTQLFVTENGEIVGEVTETDPHLKSVTIEHVEKNGQIVTYKTFVTDNTVSEIRFYDKITGFTYYLAPNSYETEEGSNNLIWTAGYVYNQAGDFVYDVYVESGGEWYTYENAFMVHIPQEYIDIKNGTLETNSLNTTTPLVLV